jgi:hypothetical protein
MSDLTVITPIGPHPTSVSADALDFAQTASSSSDTFTITGHELLLAINTDVSARTITLTTVVDPYNRVNDVTAYSVGAGETAGFWFGSTVGWRNGSGKVTISASNAALKWSVVRIPS